MTTLVIVGGAFPALAQTPTVVTLSATAITNGNATLNGSINPNGLATTGWFQWGAGVYYDKRTPQVQLGSGGTPATFTAALTGLNPGESWHYRVVASNSAGVICGRDNRFWAPQMTLNGNALLTNECHSPFVDPGITVSAFPASLAAGVAHSLALKANGTVMGWGNNTYNQISIPAGATNVVAIAAGGYHSLALRADGTVVGWGYNGDHEATAPVNATNLVAIAAASYHSLGLAANGTVFGWGYNDSGETTIPAGLANVIAIATGNSHSLALKANGTVVAWGDNTDNQTNVPVNATSVVAIAAGGSHSLALRADGTVIGWGNNLDGEVNIPVDATNIIAIAAGATHSLALRADGRVMAWGAGTFAATPSDNLNFGQSIIPSNSTNVIAITAGAGSFHSLALRSDGTVIGWGNNLSGQTTAAAGLNDPNLAVSVLGTVNINVPGTYALTYVAANTIGGTGLASRLVVVKDTTPPIVTLNGANPLIVPLGTPFINPGATASDLCAGDLTSSIQVSGAVNVNLLGNYIVTYGVTDPAGNSSSATRTVSVITVSDIINLGTGITATNAATASLTASLSAAINPQGLPSTVFFQYGLTTNYLGTTPAVSLTAGYSPINVASAVGSLLGGATYQYRVAVSNILGVVYGPNQTFTTPSPFPPGDLNGDGVVDLNELNQVIQSYRNLRP